jgi:hypothetical protein
MSGKSAHLPKANFPESLVRMSLRRAILSSLLAALVAAVAGCGGGGSDSPTADTAGSSTNGSTKTKNAEGSKSEGGSEATSPPSTEFLGKGENGKLATLGTVADDDEREAASEVIKESFEAREARDWEAQCATLAAEVIKQSEKSAAVLGAKPGCAEALESEALPIPDEAFANPMTGPINVLRTAPGSQAFAFFHGVEGKDFVIPLIKEGSEWKLAALQEQVIR